MTFGHSMRPALVGSKNARHADHISLPTHRSLNKSFLCSAHEGGTSEVLAAICGRLDLRRVYKPSSVMIMSSSLVDSFRNAMSG